MKTPAVILLDKLAELGKIDGKGQGSGIRGFIGEGTTRKKAALTVSFVDMPGATPDFVMDPAIRPLRMPGVHGMFRHTDYQEGYALAESSAVAVEGAGKWQVVEAVPESTDTKHTTIFSARRTSDPLYLGQEENGAYLFSMYFKMEMQSETTTP